jgi:hypothetical protein
MNSRNKKTLIGVICNATCQFALNEWHSTNTQTNSLRYKLGLRLDSRVAVWRLP